MKPQVNKIITELSLNRTETVYHDKTDEYYYIGTEFFVLQLDLEDYENLEQKAKDRLASILEEKGKERSGVYWMAFDELEEHSYTNFLIYINKKQLAIYDIDGKYSFLDQAITLGIEPEDFKVHSKMALIANISKKSQFAVIPFKAEKADEIIEESKYFKSEG